MKATLSTAVRGLAIAAAVGLSLAATTTASEAKSWSHKGYYHCLNPIFYLDTVGTALTNKANYVAGKKRYVKKYYRGCRW